MTKYTEMLNSRRSPTTISEALYWIVASGYDLHFESYNDYVDVIIRNDYKDDCVIRKLSDSMAPEEYESVIVECTCKQLNKDGIVTNAEAR